MKIILTELSTVATNDKSATLKINGLAAQKLFFKITNNSSEIIDGCDLLIKHGTLPNFTWNKSYWLIETGGSKTDKPPLEMEQPGSISWNTFIENIESFLAHIQDKSEITKETIEILYAINPELEKLLEPFKAVSPFEFDQQGTILKDAKGKLHNYTEKYLKR